MAYVFVSVLFIYIILIFAIEQNFYEHAKHWQQ